MGYIGEETKHAVNNFSIDARSVNASLIQAILEIKKAAALTHKKLEVMDGEVCDAIISACDRAREIDFAENFPTHPYQGGAGTSTNMNVNEVVANLASEELGRQIHPLDDVNKQQSTNDVYPSALRIACIRKVRTLSDECSKLQEALQLSEQKYNHIEKLGRTQLMDAIPMTVGQGFGAYAQAIARDRWRIYKVEERLRQINLGGTAIGDGTNTSSRYSYQITEILRGLTGLGLARAEYPMDLTQNQDVFVEVSGLLKALATNLMKIATDLRFLNSGPYGGIGEIALAKMQSGSTIMPGKVNPVIPEMITQISIQVMANDYAITMCAASGNLELNAFLPLIAERLLESLEILEKGVKVFREKCIETLTVNEDMCQKHLDESMAFATRYVPLLGYDEVERLIHQCREDGTGMEGFMKCLEMKNL